MNESGEVVAVATFKQARGENLNFGVLINEEKLAAMTSNPFVKENRQFNNKEGFVILNIPSDQDNDVILNSIHFKSDATIAYLTYTNLDMSMNGSLIWCAIGQGDEGFYIESKGQKYYVVSSSIGNNREEGTSVPLATVCKFQINFPAIDKNISKITVSEGKNPYMTFSNINLDYYRSTIKVDFENYQKEYAYSTMHEGQLEQAQTIFEDILDNDPENIQALNALGIISYVIDNNQDAINYFTEVIENHPNSISGYLNRSCVYKYQGESKKAISDITKAINIEPKAELYMSRADLYAKIEDYRKAKADIERVLQYKNYDKEEDLSWAYYKKGLCEVQLGENKLAESDLVKAMGLTQNAEMKQAILTTLEKIIPQYSSSYERSTNSASAYFTGNIGTYPITLYMSLSNNGNVQGWYYYNNKGPGAKFTLSGYYDEDSQIILHEYTSTGKNTGKFVGGYFEGTYAGFFHAYESSKDYHFSLTEM